MSYQLLEQHFVCHSTFSHKTGHLSLYTHGNLLSNFAPDSWGGAYQLEIISTPC